MDISKWDNASGTRKQDVHPHRPHKSQGKGVLEGINVAFTEVAVSLDAHLLTSIITAVLI